MRLIIVLFTFLIAVTNYAQTRVSGKVIDKDNNPIFGANVYLEGTYDGTSTDDQGTFSFMTEEKEIQTLVVSFLSFETYIKKDHVQSLKKLVITLRDDVNSLDAVMLNVGLFQAGEKAKTTVLKPLDIVTTASAVGDVLGAIQTLPGTTTVAEDGRLFVRGGSAEETQIFVDGMRVFTPYTPTANNIPTRGRFSPFLFKGVSFSTGGYSAEYGQALSSVLALNTIDKPDQEKTEIQLMTVGVGVGNTQIWGQNSLSINTSYINLAPYLDIYPDRNQWNDPFQSLNGEMVYRHTFQDDSLLKIYGAFSYTDFELIQENINFENGLLFGTSNRNLYINSSYKNEIGHKWYLETGISFTNDHNQLQIENDQVNSNENSAHLKLKFKKYFTNRFRLSLGSEYFMTDFNEEFQPFQTNKFEYGFQNELMASFAEADIYFSKNLVTQIGIRSEYSSRLKQFTLSPRASLALKTGENAQFSFAYGKFYQNPNNEFLKFDQSFEAENTQHFIANFQHTKKDQILRIEAFYKDYQDLVKFDTQRPKFESNFSNLGSGYAKGIDIFWRQNQKIENTDYWISYSYLDTERDFRNFPIAATPNFAPKHNFSIVTKHWIEKLKSQLGFAYNYASGRNFTNPNSDGFLNDKTKHFSNLSANWAYLIDQQKILYLSVNNVLGRKNVFGYNYANSPNANGIYERQAILPNADRFFFIGFFWSISDDRKSNQLNNL